MTAEQAILLGVVLTGVSGVPGLFLSRHSNVGQQIAVLLMVAGCAVGLFGVGKFLGTGESHMLVLESALPGAQFKVAIDHISAVFLFPVFVVSMLGSIYGLSYWKQSENPDNGRKLSLFFGLLAGSLALVVCSRSGVLFLTAWELMALSAFFLVGTDDHDEETRKAAWLYLAASHFATLCLFGLFALTAHVTGTFGFTNMTHVTGWTAVSIFLLALFGFGTKAGIMPVHIWLPSAHAMAPSHVSALMSGVLIKIGIYGIVRVGSQLPPLSPGWGALVLLMGAVTGVLGIAFATSQVDIKRLLAYSSIENVGIIFMGLGLAMLGRSLGKQDWVMLGLCGALLHVWNHALFKSLLFFGAGSVIHASGTRRVDELGGLAKLMPWTSRLFLIGAVAICGLPPLNGFVTEVLLYLGLFRTLGFADGALWAGAAFAAPSLALIGALAVACFVKVFGAAFLGAPRSERAQHAHESSPTMLGPMAVLAAGCVAVGLAPGFVVPILERGAVEWAAELPFAGYSMTALAPLTWISVTGLLLLAMLAAGTLVLWQRLRSGVVDAGLTWDCGYAAPSPTMQYTSSSFAQMLVELFAWALWPRIKSPKIQELFPENEAFESEVRDTVLSRVFLPLFNYVGRFFAWFRLLQQGNIQIYLLYVFAILIFLLLWR